MKTAFLLVAMPIAAMIGAWFGSWMGQRRRGQRFLSKKELNPLKAALDELEVATNELKRSEEKSNEGSHWKRVDEW